MEPSAHRLTTAGLWGSGASAGRAGGRRRWRRLALPFILGFTALSITPSAALQTEAPWTPLTTNIPISREQHYAVDGRVRPLLFFWMGRDDIGDARITWREDPDGRRAFELLIGSDPLRAPRKINRWGFIVEVLDKSHTEVLGVMKESGEETLEEAEARIARENGGMTAFKASRSTITRGTASGGTMTIAAPSDLTYRQLDELLAVVPAEPAHRRTVGLPPGTREGFLVALDTLIGLSIEPCRQRERADDVPALTYVYNQTIFDLVLESCDHERKLETRVGAFEDVVDGRFEIRNRTTGDRTKFRVMYGASGRQRGIPVRAIYRPHWWIEVELLLVNSGASTHRNDEATDSVGATAASQG
jgi:hypothetical protein